MRKSLTTLSALSLSLAACTTPNPTVITDITTFEAAVAADAKAICSVEPIFADLAFLYPIYGANISAAATAICAAVAAAPKIASATPTSHRAPIRVQGHLIHFQ